jgi:cell division septum initiation protein DivIVA
MKKILDTEKKPILLKVSLLQPTPVTTAIVPLQPQQEKIISERERLITLVERINQMARELEAAILELKAIANTLNSQKRFPLLNKELGKYICQYFAVSVPWVKRKPNESFILTTRKVDLFRAEREAALLAQQLRQQTKKRLASQRHQKNKSGAEADTRHLCKKALINKS